jgi:ADP-ribose pyrophosphatase
MKNRIASDQVVYTGAICQVHRVELELAPGRRIPRDKVEMSNAVVILPVLADGSLVLIRNERFTVEENLWEFPAGKIDSPESPQQCAERELIEETGYAAGNLVHLGGFFTCPGLTTEYIHAFLASSLKPRRQQLEEYESIQVQAVEPNRVAGMIRSGELHDAKSLAAYLLWRMRQETV